MIAFTNTIIIINMIFYYHFHSYHFSQYYLHNSHYHHYRCPYPRDLPLAPPVMAPSLALTVIVAIAVRRYGVKFESVNCWLSAIMAVVCK